jgi:hypothetical protein
MSPHSKKDFHSQNSTQKELYLCNIYQKSGSKMAAMGMVSNEVGPSGIFVWITKIKMKIEKTIYVDKLIMTDSKSVYGILLPMKQKLKICIILRNHMSKDKNT